jgi:dihydrofolate synthase/folylpolyglutamate synthase
MQLLLRPLLESDWGRAFTTIRVTGSNGKGSVTAILHSLLRSLAVECGRFISPHLIRFHERIVVGDREITDAELAGAIAWMRQAVGEIRSDLRGDQFGSFELITSVCVKAFFEAGLRVGVMEAGIGGRYDPTRLLPGWLTAITSIDLEHTDLLGGTKELIAYDKADLCPDGGTVIAARRDDDLWKRLEAYCRVRRIRLVDANAVWRVERVMPDGSGPAGVMEVCIRNNNTCFLAATPLIGTFQTENVAIACSLADLWVRASLPAVTPEQFQAAVVRGLWEVRWPGRFERISANPPVWIDVGHTPDACSRLVETVKTFLGRQPILLVTGVSANKAVEDILKILVPVADGVICTRAYHNGEQVARIASVVRRLDRTNQVWEAGTIEDAAALAKQIAQAQGMTVLVAGGLFLAVEFRTAWEGSDPKQLQFY